jgi:NitT/TauT family transport system permease protein
MSTRGVVRGVALFVGFVLVLFVVWEGVKVIGGDPWRYTGDDGREIVYDPPLSWQFASDRTLPHVWEIGAALVGPVQREQTQTLAEYLVGAAVYTGQEAVLGFIAGAVLGLVLAAIFVHSRLAERALVPYVVASQTVPILALAPLIAFAFGNGLLGIVIVATYLTFFPVTVAALKGLKSSDPRAMELLRSCAASRWDIFWKLRFPSSLPFLFSAFKIAATAAIIGAIVGEGNPGGSQFGLGRALLNFNEQFASAPAKLFAAVIASGLLGIVFFLVISAAERIVLRGRPAARAE